MGIARILPLLPLLLPCALAQAATNTTDCSWSFATQMGSGGGVLMFFLGFMTGALLIGVIWLLMDQRWRSWKVFGRSESTPQYAPLYPTPEQSYQPSMPQQPFQPGYSPGYPPQQQSYAWPGHGGYQTQYEVIVPGYR